MKFFAKLKLKLDFLKKLILIIVLLFSVNFAAPKPVEAVESSSVFSEIVTPIMDLLLNIGDGIMDKLHEYIVGQESSIIPIEKESAGMTVLKWIATAVGAIFFAAAVIALVVLSAGTVGGILGATFATGFAAAASTAVTRWSNSSGIGNRSICRVFYLYS